MTDQKLSLSQKIPKKWQEKFLIKRIGEDDIEITLEQRDAILQALNSGTRFVQIKKYTIMLNSIKSIDPFWGDDNIPPRPPVKSTFSGINEQGNMELETDDSEQKEWDLIFGKKQLMR